MSHKPDDPMTQNAENTTSLLNACNKLVNADVYQKQRISEKLRIEKELFPKCIQAPVKYENKRKTAFSYCRNKENNRLTALFPGEQVSPLKDHRMENSVRYVEQWFNRNHKDLARKPLSNLSVNTSLSNNSTSILKVVNQSSNIQNSSIKTNRKRSHSKTKVSNENSLQKKGLYSKQPRTSNKAKKQIQDKQDNDESGICMEHDLIVIDDTQESHTDKDKQAWLAVLQANEHESTSFSNLDCMSPLPHYSNSVQVNKNTSKVPFYKKSALIDVCKQCSNELHKQSKDVTITVNSKDFFTTINITTNDRSEKTSNSVLVQTEISETVPINADKSNELNLEIDSHIKAPNSKENIDTSDVGSEDLFEDDRNVGDHMNQNACVIEESDSDMEASGPLSVTVDVHRSCDQLDYGVLSEIVDVQHNRVHRGPRGNSPTSTNSSEKENYDPNRKRKSNSTKKTCRKK